MSYFVDTKKRSVSFKLKVFYFIQIFYFRYCSVTTGTSFLCALCGPHKHSMLSTFFVLVVCKCISEVDSLLCLVHRMLFENLFPLF